MMAVDSHADGPWAAPLSWRDLLFSFRGRISRRTYVTRVFLAEIVLGLLVILGFGLLTLLAHARASGLLFRPTVLFMAGLIFVGLWVQLATLVKRLHDRDRNGWLALLSVVPLANLWVYFEALFLRGPEDGNRYGKPEAEEFKSRTLAIALGILAFIIPTYLVTGTARSLVTQPFNIPAASEEPTLLIGDYLFVSKWTYGYSRYSFPFALIPFEGRFFASEPELGDTVVFKFPPDGETDYIKRVVGLPGDRVQMRDGGLYINDVAVPKVRIEDYVEDIGDGTRRVPRFRETLPNGVSYDVLDRDPQGPLDNTQVFVVPEGHFFTMGDNRDNSADSRVDVGYVPFENLVGKAEVLFFSTNGSARIWEVWKWFGAIRYARIGQYIE
jgi:signal peptidase I